MGASIPPDPKTLLTTEATEATETPETPERSGARPTTDFDTPAARARPERIADRYVVLDELGRGGLAVVYRVHDSVAGRQLALKQLALASEHRMFREQSAAFEREFHTLVQLSHPRIIEVYDFGVDERGRYYTMELLDGGDLKERSPLPWREACALIYDVCSSLALLHSRRLVHRDVSPRNVRSTLDGSAKLIDFGALVPMGPSPQVVGTPQFVAPEVLNRSTLDGRTDLFSLGATLYFALTGRFAYSARRFSRLHDAWQVRPPPPSAFVADIPPALDALVLSLVSIDPAARPRSAFEVMQRLAAIAELARAEDAEVSQAYLAAPVVVGRDEPIAVLRARIDRALAGAGSGVLVEGVAGVGRSRLLDACALEAKIAGAVVLRVNAGSEGDDPLAVGRSLAEQIALTMPELAAASALREDVTETLFGAPSGGDAEAGRAPGLTLEGLRSGGGDRSVLQSALTRWLLRVAGEQPLAILIDDVHEVDPASLALLATVALAASKLRLLLVATAQTGAAVEAVDAFAVLRRECAQLQVQPLRREHTEALAASLFGDVPNLALVADRLHQAALGNPRETMELVQSLISRKAISYQDGRWLLPGRLDAAELPSSAAESCRERVAALSPLARTLAQVHALASHPVLSRNDYALALADESSPRLDQAISELVSQHVLTGDGRAYALARREWSAALLAGLDVSARRDRHRRLAAVYAQDAAAALERADHLLAAGDEAAGLDQLISLLTGAAADSQGLLSLTRMSPPQVATLLDRALTSAERLQRKPRELYEIQRGLMAISIVTDEVHYQRAAPGYFARLAQDSGLAQYAAIADAASPGDRLMRALTLAAERHAAMPEAERVCGPEEAIRGLAYYVAVSIAIGSRMQDAALIASLPAVLEPYAALSPLLHAIWQNSIATRETLCDNQPELSRARWLAVLEALAKVSSAELSYVANLRTAIAYGIGLIEARMGFTSAEQTVRMLDDDPMQVVSAMSLRKIARLHQGDFAGAERYRKLGEQLALRANLRSMFSSTLQAELIAYALASDLTGIRQVAESIEPMAARFPSWLGYKHLADGYFEQTRGQFELALAAFERGLAVSDPAPRATGRASGAWPRLQGARIEVLVSLGRAQEARAHGEDALYSCAQHRIDAAAFPIRRALALAEAKLGDYAGASRRLEAVIADLIALGATGLELGATYEARARIAIWFSDDAAIAAFGRHTAKEYRYGQGSSLGARYERLMDEARGAGLTPLPQLQEFQTRLTTSHVRTAPTALVIEEKMAGAASMAERAARVLGLLCEMRGARGGHLYVHAGRGLECVASLGDHAPDSALDELVRRHAARHADADDCETVVESSRSPLVGSAWVDARGAAHQPLLLIGEVDGAKVCVGAAVLEASDTTAFTLGGDQLLDAVADYLLRSGDVRGATRVSIAPNQ